MSRCNAPEILCRGRIYASPTVLQRLALLDNILVEFYIYQGPSYVALLSNDQPSSSNRARMRGAVATNKEQLLARPRDGERAG